VISLEQHTRVNGSTSRSHIIIQHSATCLNP
jgi:hypothetical protein